MRKYIGSRDSVPQNGIRFNTRDAFFRKYINIHKTSLNLFLDEQILWLSWLLLLVHGASRSFVRFDVSDGFKKIIKKIAEE